MTTLIEAVRQDHRDISRLLEALEHQVDVFAAARDPDYDVILGIADYFLEYPDACHHPKEERIFQRLRETHPQAADRVGDLTREHAAIHNHTRQFQYTVNVLLNDAEIARETIVQSARSFIAAERAHMQREEDRFLPLAEHLLTENDWAQIEAELAKRADPLPARRAEARFEKLRTRLLTWEQEFQAASA